MNITKKLHWEINQNKNGEYTHTHTPPPTSLPHLENITEATTKSRRTILSLIVVDISIWIVIISSLSNFIVLYLTLWVNSSTYLVKIGGKTSTIKARTMWAQSWMRKFHLTGWKALLEHALCLFNSIKSHSQTASEIGCNHLT